jgi:hypothetical protein
MPQCAVNALNQKCRQNERALVLGFYFLDVARDVALFIPDASNRVVIVSSCHANGGLGCPNPPSHSVDE